MALSMAIAACGSTDQTQPLRADDAFIVRIARHQQTGLELARSAATQARQASVRRLARHIVSSRRQTLPTLMEQLARMPSGGDRPALGVTTAQAAEDIRPDALQGARPVDPAFLTVMTQHDRGAIALARAELQHGRDSATKAVAQRVAADSTGELARLSVALLELARHDGR